MTGQPTPGEFPRLSRRRRVAFAIVAMALPVALVALVEAGLRLGGYGGDDSLFVEPAYRPPGYLVVNPDLSRRYFPDDPNPPGLSPEPFLAKKPANGFRVFVLGESTAAGFPYLRNGAFSRVLADALRDVMPGDTVEVVNLAVAAVSSFAVADVAVGALRESPDALVVYSGHNEYYGVYGAASTRAGGANPAITRQLVRASRLRIVRLLSRTIRRGAGTSPGGPVAVSRMEQLATTAPIAPNGDVDLRGPRQLRSNLETIAAAARENGTALLVGSQASNLRDLAPFASVGATADTRADSVFARAQRMLAAARIAEARAGFATARDLDAVKFRATSEMNRAIATVGGGAVYVPAAEYIAGRAADSIPGNDLFYEHVHPRRTGIVLLARAYFDGLAAIPAFRARMQLERLRPWSEYERRMELTPVDERLAQLTVDALLQRWPFAAPGTKKAPFISTYRPTNPVDSAAFAAMIGVASWSAVKLELVKRYVARGAVDSALAELRGLEREYPWDPLPATRAGLLLDSLGRGDEALPFLQRAQQLGRSPQVVAALARIQAGQRSR